MKIRKTTKSILQVCPNCGSSEYEEISEIPNDFAVRNTIVNGRLLSKRDKGAKTVYCKCKKCGNKFCYTKYSEEDLHWEEVNEDTIKGGK